MAGGGRGQLLAPWPNRIEDGRYTFDGVEHQLPLSEVAHHNAIHGLVRWVSWTVVEHRARPGRPGAPAPPAAGLPVPPPPSVEYALTDDGLSVSTTATNRGHVGLPVRHRGTPLPEARRRSRRRPGPPIARPGRADHRRPGDPGRIVTTGRRDAVRLPRRRDRIGDLVLDHAFVGLDHGPDGRAVVGLSDPATGRAVELWLDRSHDHLMVFTGDTLPADRRRHGIAIEPMTCPPNAFRTGEDVIRLEPGASVTTTWGLRELEQP